MIELACQCTECGQWSALRTENINKAKKICPRCNHSFKIKGKFIYNCNVSHAVYNQTLDERIKVLNFKEGSVNEVKRNNC